MPRFDGTGPRGKGAGGLGRGGNCLGQGQDRGRGFGQRQCMRGEGIPGMRSRIDATQDRDIFGSSIERLQSKIEAMQARLAELKSQDKS